MEEQEIYDYGSEQGNAYYFLVLQGSTLYDFKIPDAPYNIFVLQGLTVYGFEYSGDASYHWRG